MNLNKHFEGSLGGTGGEAGGFRRGSGLVAGQGFELRSISPWSSSMLPLCPADSWLAEAPPDPPWVHRHCDVPWNMGPGTPGPSQDCQQVCKKGGEGCAHPVTWLLLGDPQDLQSGHLLFGKKEAGE